MEMLLYLALFLLPLIGGWIIGSAVERRHFAELNARDDELRSIMIITQMKRPLAPAPGKQPPRIVTAEVVIATDYLKTFMAGWRGVFGGEIRSYQSLMERARREAVLRIVEAAYRLGYNAVGNIRLDPCEIGAKAAMAAIVATGTAYHSSMAVTPREDEIPPNLPPQTFPGDAENPYHPS